MLTNFRRHLHPNVLVQIPGAESCGWAIALTTCLVGLLAGAPTVAPPLAMAVIGALLRFAPLPLRSAAPGFLGGSFIGLVLLHGIGTDWNPFWTMPLVWGGMTFLVGYANTRTLDECRDLVNPTCVGIPATGVLIAILPHLFPETEPILAPLIKWADESGFALAVAGWLVLLRVMGEIGGRAGSKVGSLRSVEAAGPLPSL